MKPLKSADQTVARIVVLLLMLTVTWRWAVMRSRYQDVIVKMTGLEAEMNEWMPLVTRTRFKSEDLALAAKKNPQANARVVLMGDSIFCYWDPPFVMPDAAVEIINRGGSGERSKDMLVRFPEDVFLVRASAVVVLAGVNDIRAGLPIRTVVNHLHSMAMLARSKRIKIVLCTLPPLPGHETEIKVLNTWIRLYAAQNHYAFLDFYTVLGGYGNPLTKKLYRDQFHPNKAGYAVMAQMTHDLLRKLL